MMSCSLSFLKASMALAVASDRAGRRRAARWRGRVEAMNSLICWGVRPSMAFLGSASVEAAAVTASCAPGLALLFLRLLLLCFFAGPLSITQGRLFGRRRPLASDPEWASESAAGGLVV